MIRVAAALLLLLVTAGRMSAHDPITTKVTFAREIRAILAARCASCHAPGGPAPMPLTTYEEVRPWARAIKEQVLSRGMPKWHAARGYGAFSNDPTLTPFELALVASWVDGGVPRGREAARRGAKGANGANGANGAGANGANGANGATGANGANGANGATGATGANGANGATGANGANRATGANGANGAGANGANGASGASGAIVLTVPAAADRAVARRPDQWVTGWSFAPGDPLIASATVSSDGGPLGTWVAGDAPVALPPGRTFRVRGVVRVELHRRTAADYERPFTPRPSVLRFTTQEEPGLRAWIEPSSCGAARTGRPADVIAVQPLLRESASARIAIERLGAPATIVGWFRNFDPLYPRTYWLARPVEFGADARLAGDAPCDVSLVLTAHTTGGAVGTR